MPTTTRERAITIRGHRYTLVPNDSDDPAVRLAYRLYRPDTGACYDLADTVHGPTCDCGDFEFRRKHVDPLGCKHVRAMVALGLMRPQAVDPPTRATWRG